MSRALQYWEGKNFRKTQVLVLGQCPYTMEDGKVLTPRQCVCRMSKSFRTERNYFAKMTRALSYCHAPEENEIRRAWSDIAFANFVTSSVGRVARKQPTGEQWKDAKRKFPLLIKKLRPAKIVVTGLTVWSKMPKMAIEFGDKLQAYQLADGEKLIWCLAIPHPASSGFDWRDMAERIAAFRTTAFPDIVHP